MKFIMVAQLEIAYLKDSAGDVVRKYFAPKNQFFIPGTWEFDEFPTDFHLRTMNFEEFKELLKKET